MRAPVLAACDCVNSEMLGACVWCGVRACGVGRCLRVLLVSLSVVLLVFRVRSWCGFACFAVGCPRCFCWFWCRCFCWLLSGRGLVLCRVSCYSLCVVWGAAVVVALGLRLWLLLVLLGVFVVSRVRSGVSRGAACGALLLPGFSWCPVLSAVSVSGRARRRVGSVPVPSSVLFLPASVPSRAVGGSVLLGFASSPLVSGGRLRSGLVAGLGLSVLSWLSASLSGRLGASLASPGSLPVLGSGAFWWRRFVRAGLLSAAVRGCLCRRRVSAPVAPAAPVVSAAPVAPSGGSGAWVPVFRRAGSGVSAAPVVGGVAAPVVPVSPAAVSASAAVRGGLRVGVRAAVVSPFAGSVLLLSSSSFGAAVSRGGCPVALAFRAFVGSGRLRGARSAVFRALCCACASGVLSRFLASGSPGASALRSAVASFRAAALVALGSPSSLAGVRSLAAPVFSAAASGSLPALSWSVSSAVFRPVGFVGVFRSLAASLRWLVRRGVRSVASWACSPWLALLLLWLGRV